jgi:phosphatidate cytidylyltransferase
VLGRRLVAGSVLAALVVVAVTLGGPPYPLVGPWAGGLIGIALAMTACTLAQREFYALAAHARLPALSPVGLAASYALLLAAWLPAWLGAPEHAPVILQAVLGLAVLTTLAAALLQPDGGRRPLVWATTLAGTLYVGWLLSYFLLLRWRDNGFWWTWLAFLPTWGFDSAAYFAGRAFGRHPFMPHISPRKTWEGVAAGLAAAVAVAGLVLWPLGQPLWHALPLGLLLGMAAQTGDLAESMLKRAAGAKDASALIPGHGGMLDRIDSLLFAVVIVYGYALVAGGGPAG